MTLDRLRKTYRQHPRLVQFLVTAAGGVGGFAYYHFIGCASGTCPITGNPYISTIYGAGLGFLLTTGKKR